MKTDPLSFLPASAFKTQEKAAGDLVFRQGDPTVGLYRVEHGLVFLRRFTPNGDTMILHRAERAQLFAEASIFSETYHCDAVMAGVGQVTRVCKLEVQNALHNNPAFAESFNRLLARQVQQYRHRFEMLTIKSAPERVLTAIQAGYLDDSISDFAKQINLTHEACYRALRVLCDNGKLLKVARGKYVLVQTGD